jgi:hypothetical protein
MKYQVQISYTNPAHEHISLRRRVDTVTRIVEARTEQEALNRAANQQRALGFMIKEAKVSKGTAPTTPKEKKLAAHYGDPVKITKGDVVTARIKSGIKEEVEQVDELNYEYNIKRLPPKGFTVPHQQNPHLHYNPKTKQVHNTRTGETYRDYGNEFVGYRMQKNEEVEQIDEVLTASDPASKWISDFVKSDNPKFAGKSKKERINMALGAYYAATRGNKKD